MNNSHLRTLSDREWILTNGIGGYGLGYGHGANKRKYNGLLIASDPLLKRTHLLASIEEKLSTHDLFFYLDTNHYPNCIHPYGCDHLIHSWLRPYPSFLFAAAPTQQTCVILKEIWMVPGQNTIIVAYTNKGRLPFTLTLRPKFSFRDHHHVNPPRRWDQANLSIQINNHAFTFHDLQRAITAHGYCTAGNISEERVIYRQVFYPIEAMRGYDATEDLIAPVVITAELQPKESLYFLLSDAAIDSIPRCIKSAKEHYARQPIPATHPARYPLEAHLQKKEEPTTLYTPTEYMRILKEMAEQFYLEQSDIIAGYPWFGAWGRDTMISLSGMKHLFGGKKRAIAILKKYGLAEQNGLIPNIFGEGGIGTNFDTVDAPLWFVLRSFEMAPKDPQLFEHASSILLNYLFNKNLPFFVDANGLVTIRANHQALTWMDAKVYGAPVTPRHGQPVEINALWLNALMAIEKMATQLRCDLKSNIGSLDRDQLHELIQMVTKSMQQFVGNEFLADRIEEGCPVWEIRPNAIIALSLPFDFVSHALLKKAWRTAKQHLLTPAGLRSLSPDSPAFKQKYIGNQKQRDMIYHQGTVWSWLLLPFAKVTWKAWHESWPNAELNKEISNYTWMFRDAIMRGSLASVPEIWDGLNPTIPRGCPAQAWSVMALLEIESFLSSGRWM